jgi:P4 family phage/plasmid primase-like protien
VGSNGHGTNGHQKIDWLSSWITPEWIDRAGIYRVDHQTGAQMVGRHPKVGQHFEGIIIPYFLPGDPNVREYRLRRDIPDYEQEPDGTRKEKGKYLHPAGRGNIAYFPPGTKSEWLTDSTIRVVIVEGEKKSLALARFFAEQGEQVLIIALPGVWNFRGKVGIETGPQGERVTVKGVIADIERVTWRARQVRILFDTNAATNESVSHARRELARQLIRRGAMVRLLDLPPEEGVNGVDDFLGRHGATEFAKFLEESDTEENRKAVLAFPLTDLGNAERLIARYGCDLKWSTVQECWYFWDGKRWVKDERLIAEAWAKDTIRAIPAVEGSITEEGDDLRGYARKCESRDKIGSLLSLARSETGVPVQLAQFDSQPYLFNCLNGTLDLRTGELKAHDRADLLTKLCPIVYDPAALAPRWLQFLDEVFAGDRELIDFLWQAIGYTLLDGNPAKSLFICWGPSNTGKSTFQAVMRELFGEYSEPADIQTFMGRVSPMVYNDLADLYGARLVTASENSESDRLNDGLVKMVTGNDPVTACRKYENPFKYVPGFKVWLGVNHKPIVSDGSKAIFNRVKLIPFEVVFDESSADLTLESKLLAELPGILAWALRGCHDWLENGFRIPEKVKAAVEEYQRESDVVGEFIEDVCVVGDDCVVRSGDLYDRYVEWTKNRGARPMSGKMFARKIEAKGFKAEHGRTGNYRVGIGVKAL